MTKNYRQIFFLIFLILLLPLFIWTQSQVITYLSRASVKKANLVVDTLTIDGEFKGNWLNFAQGGEEPPPMLNNTVERMKLLKPQYIRLDHIYDFYDVVKGNGQYDFSKLDQSVSDILTMGAKPFFSLSYMPRQFTPNQSVIDIPSDWANWQKLVKATIEHYSGKANINLKEVYYEVWNEPDLPQFGSWKLGGNKNYNLLYQFASYGARDAENVNNFFIGGPAVGSFYPKWVDDFVSYIDKNNLRLDFYSWHRYHSNPDRFREDVMGIRKLLSKYPKFSELPLVLSEWGLDSERNLNNNSDKAASHALSTIFKIEEEIDRTIAFEIKDGPPSGGGKWGLMTHEKDEIPLKLKPRFKALAASTLLLGTKLKISGWGSNVTALASKTTDETINILIGNYDWRGQNWENVPVTVTGLDSGIYKIKNQQILTNSVNVSEMVSTDGQLKLQFIMLPNSIRLLEIKKSGHLAQYIDGAGNQAGDKALALTGNDDFKLDPFEFEITPNSEISFDIKPLWTGEEIPEINVLKLELAREDTEKIEVIFKKVTSNDIDFWLLTASDNKNADRLAIPAGNLNEERWHKVQIRFSSDKISLRADDIASDKNSPIYNSVSKITGISFYPFNGAIDNLEIIREGVVSFKRDFN
ncbi:hypothetical protein A2153_05250 [Candidatus Gottesmanbacteria bacterium RBG_16_38_7b]|uniref:Glycosyl hydrolases family 39 N-terminal catalytic domain-containing protein n=1 Tax=Candidatus Gottesmanbacteria bacterium RBG_16_38_7b TaxID=1798372 RepID=A0A1F5YF83_9BACT|nr:MAG: hypothetical protein A2153_05250 [Candidatus Gottesmanbacteria bacterium RBG_16_38_7b]